MDKTSIGRPGVIQLVIRNGRQQWTRSRKPVSVESAALSPDGGDVVANGVRYRAAALPGYPGDGAWRFTEHRAPVMPEPPEDNGNGGRFSDEDEAMIQDIISHARHDKRLVDVMEEFGWLHKRDPKKAHRFYRMVRDDGWRMPDRETLGHVREMRRRLETEDWRTPEELEEWRKNHERILEELKTLPLPGSPDPDEPEDEEFSVEDYVV